MADQPDKNQEPQTIPLKPWGSSPPGPEGSGNLVPPASAPPSSPAPDRPPHDDPAPASPGEQSWARAAAELPLVERPAPDPQPGPGQFAAEPPAASSLWARLARGLGGGVVACLRWLFWADRPATRPGIIERFSLLWLLLITVAGALYRFLWIDKPVLWTDEAYTYRRVVASFKDLLDVLQYDGFAPLSYEAVWWIKELLGGPQYLTPFWMRLVPALAGTAMIPAMYFLSRQLTNKRTSLVVALFTACSAYMMVYSHDAKMYMLLWLGVALNVAALLWWFRSNLRLAWLTWIAAGLLVGGTHAPGLVVLAVQPLYLLTQRRMHWKKLVLFALGLVVIASGPLVHYTQFNKWTERVEEEGWGTSGLGWVSGVLQRRDGTDMAKFVGTAYLMSWEWPDNSYRDDDPTFVTGRNGSVAINRMPTGFNIAPPVRWGLMSSAVLILLLCIVGALPWTERLRGHRLPELAAGVEPAWRQTLWLSLWICLPAYAFYLFSYRGMNRAWVDPSYFLDSATAFVRDLRASCAPPEGELGRFLGRDVTGLILALALAAGLAAACHFVRRLALFLTLGLALVLAAAVVTAAAEYPWTRPVGLADGTVGREYMEWWRLAYIGGLALQNGLFHEFHSPSFFKDRILASAMYLGYFAVLPALVWHCGARTLAGRAQRFLAMGVALAALYGSLWLIYQIIDPRLRATAVSEIGPIFVPRYLGAVWPAIGVAVCALLMRLPTRALRLAAVVLLLGVNSAQSWHRMFAGTEPRQDLIVRDLARSQERSWAVLTETSFGRLAQTGVASQVIERLRPLKDWDFWDKSALEDAVRGRLSSGQWAAHGQAILAAAESRRTNFRMYIQAAAAAATHPNPGGGWIGGGAPAESGAKYYTALENRTPWPPQRYREVTISSVFSIWGNPTPARVATEMRSAPQIRTVVIWDRYPNLPEDPAERLAKLERALISAQAGVAYRVDNRWYDKSSVAELQRSIDLLKRQQTAPPAADEYETALRQVNAGWKRVSEEWFVARYHWNWSELYAYRRREYVRE